MDASVQPDDVGRRMAPSSLNGRYVGVELGITMFSTKGLLQIYVHRAYKTNNLFFSAQFVEFIPFPATLSMLKIFQN